MHHNIGFVRFIVVSDSSQMYCLQSIHWPSDCTHNWEALANMPVSNQIALIVMQLPAVWGHRSLSVCIATKLCQSYRTAALNTFEEELISVLPKFARLVPSNLWKIFKGLVWGIRSKLTRWAELWNNLGNNPYLGSWCITLVNKRIVGKRDSACFKCCDLSLFCHCS